MSRFIKLFQDNGEEVFLNTNCIAAVYDIQGSELYPDHKTALTRVILNVEIEGSFELWIQDAIGDIIEKL